MRYMMKRVLIALLLLCGISAAHAQTPGQVVIGGQSTNCSGSIVPCFVPGLLPPALNGQGYVTASTSAYALNSASLPVTALTPGLAYPSTSLPAGIMQFANLGAAAVYICWRGYTTCSPTTGWPLAPGATRTVALPFFQTQPPTLISATGTVVVELEW